MTRHALIPLVACCCLLSGCALSFQNLPLGRNAPGPSYAITATFADASGLQLGGQVDVGQDMVGRISAITTKDFVADVTLNISKAVTLPKGTTAQLALTSALGEEYVVLRPPAVATSAILGDGATIPESDTSRGPDLEDTLAALGTVLNGSGLDQAKTIVTELNSTLGGHEQQARDLFARLDGVLTTLSQHSTDIDTVIDSMNSLSGELVAHQSTLDAALTSIAPAVNVLLAQRDQFSGLLTSVNNLAGSVNGVLATTGAAITTQLRQLQPILDSLDSFNSELGSTLTQLNTFHQLIDRATPGDYLLLDGTIDVPNTLLALLTGSTSVGAPTGLTGLVPGGTP